MNSSICSQYYTRTQCIYLCNNSYDSVVQEKLDSVMPFIGMYIAAASAACSLAIAADAFNAFRSKMLWFPCKYFSLNAFSLALLAVAMKLPIDLTSLMLSANEKVARVSSLVFLSIVSGNFMTSLGSMENNEIMLNLAALGILLITVTGNVSVYVAHMLFFNSVVVLVEEIACSIVLLLLLVILCSLSIMVPSARKHIETVYQKQLISVSKKKVKTGNFDELRTTVTRYWVMAQTGSLQFVIARSAMCATSSFMCLLTALILLEALIRIPQLHDGSKDISQTSSNYKWSISWILYIQSIGVLLGSIAPLFRWVIAAKLKKSKISCKSFKDEFKVEPYWTQILVEWRDSLLPLQIRHHILRKFLHDAKRLLLNFCIKVQVLIVLMGKIGLLISATCVKLFLFCFCQIKNYFFGESGDGTVLDFTHYVVLLEGETELPVKTLRNICKEVDKLIQIGRQKQPENLIKLLNKSENFNGVTVLNREQIPSLRNHLEPPNCWSLPIVTLSSIAIALPNVTPDKSNELLRGVSEGLYFVKLIEKALYRNGELASIRNAADAVWLRVDLYRQWLDTDIIQDIRLKSNRYTEVLIKMSAIANTIMEDVRTLMMGDFLMENPLSWPFKYISANSMYRISQTIMEGNRDIDGITEEELFGKLSIMISDILSACLTNLGRAINSNCHSSAIKEKEECVRQAALLLGKSEKILKVLQKRELPSLDAEKAAYIDEWRPFMEQAATSTTIPNANGEQVIDIRG